MKTYPTDLTESQWQVIENIVDPNQRKRKYSLHEIMNALLYIAKSGHNGECSQETLPLGNRFITTSASGKEMD